MNNNKLLELYNKTSKHSHYQVLSKPLRDLLSTNGYIIKSRFEQERFNYLTKHLTLNNFSLVDIGGNTGFFTLESIHHGAASVLYIEGNNTHCDFVKEAVRILKWENRVTIHNEYINFQKDLFYINSDICLLLNVLHHVGDDYCKDKTFIEQAKTEIIHSLINLHKHTRYLIFQLGFNWKGNTNTPLFTGGTKKEIIHFIENKISEQWTIECIGIAEKTDGTVTYNEINNENIKRNDLLGEFLNRPIFILKSKYFL